MIPSNALALQVFLVAVAPGYVYQRVVERRLSRQQRSGLVEAVDLLCVGAFCSTVAALLALALGEAFRTAFLRLADLAGGVPPLSWRHVGSLVVVLTASAVIAGLVGVLRVRLAERAAQLDPGTVWTNTFARFARGPVAGGRVAPARPTYLVVQLRDGRTVGGQLAFADVGEDPDKRDLTLAAPLWIASPGSAERHPQPFAYTVVPGKDISLIWGRTLDPVSQHGQAVRHEQEVGIDGSL